MKTQCFFYLLTLLVLPVLASAIRGRSLLPAAWQPIEDVKDPQVVEIGTFAVDEYDKSFQADLKFVSVVKGETQVVKGTNYRLVVQTNDGSVSKNYEAIVFENLGQTSKNLTSFVPVEPYRGG